MTIEPRQEAKQAVEWLMSACMASGSAETWKQINPFPQVEESWQSQVDERHTESGRRATLLVDVLAAAIEYVHEQTRQAHAVEDVRRKRIEAFERLREALSALREDKT